MSDPSESGGETARKDKPEARRKLGRGLGALMGDARREQPLAAREGQGRAGDSGLSQVDAAARSGLANIAVSQISPHPEQPRRHFDEDSLNELAASIESRGVIQPVIVRPLAGGYQLVAGERRWRAAQKAQLHEIPALIRDLSDRDVMALALIENIQREDLNPIEEARAYQRLAEFEGLTQSDIAKMVEKSRSHVANLQRLLTLPATVIDHLEAGRLSMGHARALIGHDAAEMLADQAVAKKLSVREVERLARKQGTRGGEAQRSTRATKDTEKDPDIAAVERHLEEFLGLSVQIATDAELTSGSVTIRYTSLDQLDVICQRLTGGGF